MNNRELEISLELKNILLKTKKDEKHRGYHILPERLNSKIDSEELKNKYVFYEKERLAYMKLKVDFRNKTVLDIGCNMGYFLFDLLDTGARKVTGYEGKILCGEFLDMAIGLLNEKNRFEFYNAYFNFNEMNKKYNVVLLLNVLHHFGDDYGDKSLNMEKAKYNIIAQLNSLSKHASIIIYQMGFNWQGNIKKCLFENGTKAEMIEYIKQGTKDYWDIIAVGIAERINDGIVYKELSENNIERDDSLGEFLNRPIFILKSKAHN